MSAFLQLSSVNWKKGNSGNVSYRKHRARRRGLDTIHKERLIIKGLVKIFNPAGLEMVWKDPFNWEWFTLLKRLRYTQKGNIPHRCIFIPSVNRGVFCMTGFGRWTKPLVAVQLYPHDQSSFQNPLKLQPLRRHRCVINVDVVLLSTNALIWLSLQARYKCS